MKKDLVVRNMLFQCRNCGKTSTDIDMVLDGACECNCTHFKLVSETPLDLPPEIDTKESIRRDLHHWIDLNIDSMDPDQVSNMRVFFEIEKR
ncbi:MAG: hypothetical protein ACFE7R_10590 [Candidatus Hodarchaeota archaeon]